MQRPAAEEGSAERRLLEEKTPAPPRDTYVATKPRNPRHFEIIEGGRAYRRLSVTIQPVKAIYEGKAIVSDTFGVQAVSETRFPAFILTDGLRG